LIVAFPFALGMEALCTFERPWMERRRLAAGFLGTLAWFFALRYGTRFFWWNAALPWTFCAVTVAMSLLFEWRLQDAAKMRDAHTG
jgi:hypothetical protein